MTYNFRRLRDQLRAANKDALVRRVASGSLWSLLIKLASAGLTYAMLAALARAMTAPEYGRFGFTFNLTSFLAVLANPGLYTAIMRWMPQYEAAGRPDQARRALRWSTLYSVGGGAAMTILMLVVITVFPISGPRSFLYAGAAFIMPFLLAEFLGSALRAKGSVIWAQAPRDILWRIAVLSVTAIVLASGGTLTALEGLLLVTITLSLALVPQFILLARDWFHRDTPVWPDLDQTRAWRRELLPFWGPSVIYASTQYIDVVLVGLMVSTGDAGAYFAASRTASLAVMMLTATNMVSAPLISEAYHSHDTPRLARTLRIVAICIVPATLLVALGLIIAGPWLLALFDPSYVSAYWVLVVLVIAHSINSLGGPLTYVLQMTGHGADSFRIMAMSYAIGVVTQVILLLTIGMIGAAIGTCVAIVLWGALGRSVSRRKLGLDPTVFGLFRLRSERL